ncbi:IS256 family transposase [Skermania piniformis]|uniref:Mutator family transposase n=1 Tax=Skermania pinensis TaxID=39122 RepID=A0ABX8S4P9_9ACTN|nr:IS256 family transposase [Skermania piniformis]QXQ12813.1 IS256 family transposase [Skermania piniformis]
MTETLDPVAKPVDQRELAEQLLAQAKQQGVDLVGPNGLLNQLTKNVLETALDAEMTEHLGYDKHDPNGRGSGNSRNVTRSKTVLTEIGPVQIEVPRDTDASFDPQIVRKRQRRLTGVDEIVLSLSAKGLTTGEIAAHFDDVYGARVSKDTISPITDKVIGEMTEWQNRPLDAVYPVVFIDAIHVKIRDGQVSNRPVYVAIGVTVNGERDILGLWAGDGGEGAKFWLAVLSEIKNRGAADVCIVVCDGLKGLPDAIGTVWPQAVVQTCVIHLIRNTFRYASRKYWDEMSRDLRPVYTAPTEAAAKERFVEFTAKWGAQYPAITRMWDNAWSEFVPFLDYDIEIRRVICSTNAIESLNARYRRAVRARGHFPSEQAALKCLYLATRALDPTGRGKARWAMRWKPALNAFAIAFEGRINPSGN